MGQSTAELWSRYRQRCDEESWEELVTALKPLYARVAFRAFRRYGINPWPSGEDGLQEAMLKLTAQRDGLPVLLGAIPDSAVEPYFRTLAANAIQDFLR